MHACFNHVFEAQPGETVDCVVNAAPAGPGGQVRAVLTVRLDKELYLQNHGLWAEGKAFESFLLELQP